jgi:hypothetical protein
MPPKREPKQPRNSLINNPPTSSFGLPPRPAAAPVPQTPPQPAGISGQLPPAPGTTYQPSGTGWEQRQLVTTGPEAVPLMIDEASLTEAERQQLHSIGWRPGMAVPANLPDILARQQAERALNISTLQPPGDPTTPPLVVPPPTRIEDLPPAHRAELEQALQSAMQQYQQPAAAAPLGPVQPGGPGVAEAARGVADRTVQLQDDRATAPPPAQSAATGPTHCPRCQWDQRVPDTVEATPEDKAAYLAATLGAVQFAKTYTALDGNCEMAFRELNAYESDACFVQLTFDMKQDRLDGTSDYQEWLRRYRLATQLVSISLGDRMWKNNPLADWKAAEGEPTPLRAIFAEMCEDALTSESLIRIALNQLGEFNRLTVKLENNATNPGFWRATGSPV